MVPALFVLLTCCRAGHVGSCVDLRSLASSSLNKDGISGRRGEPGGYAMDIDRTIEALGRAGRCRLEGSCVFSY